MATAYRFEVFNSFSPFPSISFYNLLPIGEVDTAVFSERNWALSLLSLTSFLLLLVFKRPSLDGDMPGFQKLSEVLDINAVMAARQAKGFKSAALYPFQYRAFADLTVGGDVS